MSRTRFIFRFLFLLLNYQSLAEELNLVETETGTLRGVQLTSRQNRAYFGFLGIQYGKIPERFTVAEPPENWTGVKDVKDLPLPCFHYNLFVGQGVGVEDCLHLNVYSPKPKNGENLPVMFWIFPGGFQLGGASGYDPKYFMDQDVVVVTINYRLGALGFLNTGDGTVTGNMGLKDQVLALKWVQANIKNFGGDPNLVTIFGLSAGGASVDYLTLSPIAKGTFHRAAALSGSSLNPWAYQPKPLELAEKFTENSGCSRLNSEWPEKVKCLQALDVSTIMEAQLKLMTLGIDFDFLHMQFVPSIESHKVSTPRFLEDSPYNLLSQGKIANKVPYLTGFTDNEGPFFTAKIFQSETLMKAYDANFTSIAPFVLYYDNCVSPADQTHISERVRKFYLGEKRIAFETREEVTNIFSDRLFLNGIAKGIKLHAVHQPVYPYISNFDGQYSLPEVLYGAKESAGTTHADDLIYLFNQAFGAPEISTGTRDGDFSENYLKLLVSFARDGKPTSLWGKQKEWPAHQKGDTPIRYFMINEHTELLDDIWAERRAFWDKFQLGEHQYEAKVSQRTEL